MKETMGDRILNLLNKNKMTQRELAKKIGVSEISISRYINGHRTPNGTIVGNIAMTLHTTSDYLLGQNIEENPEVAYYHILRMIKQNAKNWSQKQKIEIINTLYSTN